MSINHDTIVTMRDRVCEALDFRFRGSSARLVMLALILGVLKSFGAETKMPDVVDFNRHIRPIMSNTCFKCHGPDVKNNKSDVRLDLPESAYAQRFDNSGRKTTPLVPGKPAESEAWRRIVSADATQVMPPADSLHQLSVHDKALFKKWIELGARYAPHWAYVVPQKAPVPVRDNAANVRNVIDHFILQELNRQGVAPSAEADRPTLIRRLSLDLTGLPPTPEETRRFVGDTAPGAYERVVDRLLASEHYGERMAVPWLDLVRFADSVGFHGDQLQNNFPYRDYVIAAFNRNKSFDKFTKEQIAGDLLTKTDVEQLVATGFNRLNMMTREGGAQSKEYLAKYAADRVRTVSTAFLGSTVGCAECHDHKYDPFTTRDFYAFSAYFSDIKQWGVYSNFGGVEPELRGFTDNHPFPPEIEVESAYLKRRIEQYRARYSEILESQTRALLAKPEADGHIQAWLEAVRPKVAADPGGWINVAVEAVKLGSNVGVTDQKETDKVAEHVRATIFPDSSVRLAGSPVTRSETLEVTVRTVAGPLAALRLELLPDEALGGSIIRRPDEIDGKPGSYLQWVSEPKLVLLRGSHGTAEPIALMRGIAEIDSEGYFNGRKQNPLAGSLVMGERAGLWDMLPSGMHDRHAASWLLAQPVTLVDGDRLVVTIEHTGFARLKLSTSPLGLRLPDQPLTAAEVEAFRTETPTAGQRQLLAAEYLKSSGPLEPGVRTALFQDLSEIAGCGGGLAATVVTEAKAPVITRVLPRGNWQDDSGEVVKPTPPAFLSGMTNESGGVEQRATRLDLAKWIVSRENPLTSRTFVNRLWKQFFGTGLSAVVDDLGMQGEYPSHPELLDWLAVEFMDCGWDVKAMVRLIVTSATYRQSSRFRPELVDLDPYNRLLARQSPRRLDAEFVRDNALAVADLLNRELGGPSVYPYQPEGYYAALLPPVRDYIANTDERQYRRGVYMHWQRTFLHPMLNNFDAPSREECTAARPLSTTPLQALTLLNDPSFVEAARVLATRVIQRTVKHDFNGRLDEAMRRVLGRPPTEKESASLEKFYLSQLAYFSDRPGEASKLTSVGAHPTPVNLNTVELAAWTSVARALLNLNESIVRY